MDLEKVLAELAEAGTEQNRKVYARHGVGMEMFGLSFKFLRQKNTRANTNLLWHCGRQIIMTRVSWR